MSTPTSRIPALDGLRGLAVLIVFCFHYAGGTHSSHWFLRAFGRVNEAGWSGVTLFFVLSGFLITGILWDSSSDPHWLRNFYMRRALRILPLYYGALALALIAAAIAGEFRGALHSIWIPILFLQNFPGLSERVQQLPSPLILHHLWTLAVEEQFYLLWPLLLLRRSHRSATRLCIAIFCLSLAFRIGSCAFGWQIPDSTAFLLSRAGELAAGAWLALAYRGCHWQFVQRIAPVTLLTSLAIFGLTSWMQGSALLVGNWQYVVGLLAVTAAFASLLALLLRPGRLQRLVSAAWLRWLGTMSFGIYVFHLLLRPLYWQVTHRIVPNSSGAAYLVTRFIVAATATLAISWMSYRFYETRFLRMKRRFASAPKLAGT
jgi:peptidoglycan/LPS O-acetylase OafA/YrhL